LLAAALVATALPALATTVAPGGEHLVPGFYDPKTGTFKPVATPNVNPNATTYTRDGTFVANITLSVKSDIASNTPIYVELDASTFDGETLGFAGYYDDSAVKEATRISASEARVAISLPYSWSQLLTPTKDVVTLTYYVYAGTPLVAAGETFAFARTSTHAITTLAAVPANNATTTETVTETI
jgi:hypothetical protein